MSLLIFLILILLLFWFLRPLWRVYRSFNQIRNSFNQSMNGNNQSSSSNKQNTQKRKQDKDDKIIPEGYGEYVEFTETTSFSNDTISTNTKQQKKEYREEQISDAEWEEVK